MELETFFSPDYSTARERFRQAARAAAALPDTLELDRRGPRGEALAIETARIGDPRPRRVLLHCCGLHGVEAFAGAAVQLAALADPPAPPAGCALVFAHVLNPYGMAWLRRANENNVDLNRNFLRRGERWEGAPELYPRLDPLINPATPPGRTDGFAARLALFALRHGLRRTKQAIAEGQHEYPRGLFYGGGVLETGPRLFLDWLRRRFSCVDYLLALDLHTGLGRRGEETLILEADAHVTPAAALEKALGRRLVDPAAGRAIYRARGTLGGILPQVLPAARVDFVLQEIGTQSALAVLQALREENRCHHYGAPDDLTHPAKRALLEAHCPAAARWRRLAVARGLGLLGAAAAWTFGRS